MLVSDWEHVGTVDIGGGMLVVGDPFDLYPSGVQALDDVAAVPEAGPTASGLAVAVHTGFGDGVYPVEVRYADVPGWGTRVVEMRVRFISSECECGEWHDTEEV